MSIRWTHALILALGVALAVHTAPAAAQQQQGAYDQEQMEPEAVDRPAIDEVAPEGALDPIVLDDPTRPEDERAQDEYRKPIELYQWLGVAPGKIVADVYPGDGYNTHLLSRLMGDTPMYSILRFYDGITFDPELETYDVRLKKRVAEKGLTNVVVVTEFDEVADNAIDIVLMVRNFHDIGNYFEDLDPRAELEALYEIVKPGGIVGVVEVATDRPGFDEETHRLNKSVVIEDFEATGFELVEESDLLANPDDDYSTSGFEEGRHTMDRYALKFRKPVESS